MGIYEVQPIVANRVRGANAEYFIEWKKLLSDWKHPRCLENECSLNIGCGVEFWFKLNHLTTPYLTNFEMAVDTDAVRYSNSYEFIIIALKETNCRGSASSV